MTQLLTNNVPRSFEIPYWAFLMLRPEILTVLRGGRPNTSVPWLPSTASWLAPGPEIVTFLVTPSPPLVSVMVPH